MISIVNGVLIKVTDPSSLAVEVKPVCPHCGKAEGSSWNHETCYAPRPNNYVNKKTNSHICSSCRKSFTIALYNN